MKHLTALGSLRPENSTLDFSTDDQYDVGAHREHTSAAVFALTGDANVACKLYNICDNLMRASVEGCIRRNGIFRPSGSEFIKSSLDCRNALQINSCLMTDTNSHRKLCNTLRILYQAHIVMNAATTRSKTHRPRSGRQSSKAIRVTSNTFGVKSMLA